MTHWLPAACEGDDVERYGAEAQRLRGGQELGAYALALANWAAALGAAGDEEATCARVCGEDSIAANSVVYCIVLYCIVLYCIVLCCIVLYCIYNNDSRSIRVEYMASFCYRRRP